MGIKQRKLGRTNLFVSEVGLGCEHLEGMAPEAVRAVTDAALESGVNLFDVFMSEPQVRSNLGAAVKGRRGSVMIQGHIGSAWLDGQYGRTREPGQCAFFFDDLLQRLDTDYIDIGMLHFVDTREDYRAVFASPIIDYAVGLREKGVIRALGLSSHNPAVAEEAVRTGLIDVLMFSVNPAYDLLPEDTVIDDLFIKGTYEKGGLVGIHPARDSLYKACANNGTAITVMKGLGAGALLDAGASPFGVALTPIQCIHYALTRPAVASILVGCRTPQEVYAAVAYETATERERDYSVLLSATPKFSMKGRCMYCNHCLPCPAHIDIAQVNKYLDLALAGGGGAATLREHYRALEHSAEDCTACGSCEGRCPFGVSVISRMEQARTVFAGK